MTDAGGAHVYIGRFGMADGNGERLLVDWRAPAAAPFFAASGGHPMGLTSRRRHRWTHGRIVDYWDEVFAPDGVDHSAALDDQSAFIASLGASRSAKMRDVLATIQADQDAVIRAGAQGSLVVDGGPGTGKTVVALHRAAYLLYADPRLQAGRGGLLFVGPHRPYLDYIDVVFPSLGEEGAVVATLADLVTGVETHEEPDEAVRRAKADGRLVDAVEAAVRLWEQPPRRTLAIETPWGPVPVTGAGWAEVFADADGELSHNDVRGEAWDRLLDLLGERVDTTLRGGAGVPAADDRWLDGWGDASVDDGHRDAIAAEGEFDAPSIAMSR